MLVELRNRSQITIPAEIIRKIGVKPGDKFEVIEKDGGIFLLPVVVYPKAEMKRVAMLVKEADDTADKLKAYDSVDQLFQDMGIDLDEV